MQRHFFATGEDLLPVFEHVERKHKLRYTQTGVFSNQATASTSSGAAIPTLRNPAPSANAINGYSYLVTPAEAQVAVRPVAGGTRFAVDQLANPDSITFMPGAIYQPNVHLYGRAASASDSEIAKKLFGAFAYAIGKLFVRVQGFYVGPQAFAHWRDGYRLTIGADSPPEFDLAPDPSKSAP